MTLRHIAGEGRTYVIGVTSCISAAGLPASLPAATAGPASSASASTHHPSRGH